MDGDVLVRHRRKGAGMGLTIVQRLQLLMDGATALRRAAVTVEAAREATPGPHALALPQVQEAVADGEQAPHPAAPAPPAAADEADEAPAVDVLYIEDNPVNALLMQTLFQMRPQWRLQVAVDGESGVAEALRCRPRLLLVDMHLPDMNGIEVLAELRRHEALREVPAVVVSAAAMSSDIEQAQAAGFAAYWTKPLDLPRMLGELDTLLG